MTLKQRWKNVRPDVFAAATFWKRSIDNEGVRLSLKGASPLVRFAMLTGYEAEDARLCRKYIAPGDGVLELGSSIGFIAIFCLKQVGVQNYAMVEANPALLPIMQENFKLNHVALPAYLNVAAGGIDGEATFNVSRDYWASSLNSVANAGDAVTVPVLTIPSIIAKLGFKPNVLVMDIEGAETQIPLDHLAQFDKIIVEFHRRFVGDEPIDNIIAGLEARGFTFMETDGLSSAFVKNMQ